MNTQTKIEKKWALALLPHQDAYLDFILSRHAMMCTKRTMEPHPFKLVKNCSMAGKKRYLPTL